MVFIVSTPAAQAHDVERWDRYLDRPRGPYRGQVVDAQTKVPLAGAVVVALWRRDRVHPIHSVSEHYAVREIVTDEQGRFFLDAKDVEENAPRRTYHPEFLIFQPGYGSYPRHQVSPRGFTGGIFEKRGTVVELPRLEGHEERRIHLRAVSPSSFSEQPFKDIPELMRRVNDERATLGLNLYVPVEK
ncbi:MAG TPA: hypothetical protein VLK35_06775 [Methylomirabilota bacterium]|nr:hypothetical protein [Methylomirabilota bacterium]